MADARYGSAHRALRSHWQRVIASGQPVACWRCKQPVTPGMEWHMGHTDDGSRHAGPEHAKCNLRAQNESRAADARKWRSGRAATALLEAECGAPAYEDPECPGVICRDW